jgi:hypothetical protein
MAAAELLYSALQPRGIVRHMGRKRTLTLSRDTAEAFVGAFAFSFSDSFPSSEGFLCALLCGSSVAVGASVASGSLFPEMQHRGGPCQAPRGEVDPCFPTSQLHTVKSVRSRGDEVSNSDNLRRGPLFPQLTGQSRSCPSHPRNSTGLSGPCSRVSIPG